LNTETENDKKIIAKLKANSVYIISKFTYYTFIQQQPSQMNRASAGAVDLDGKYYRYTKNSDSISISNFHCVISSAHSTHTHTRL